MAGTILRNMQKTTSNTINGLLNETSFAREMVSHYDSFPYLARSYTSDLHPRHATAVDSVAAKLDARLRYCGSRRSLFRPVALLLTGETSRSSSNALPTDRRRLQDLRNWFRSSSCCLMRISINSSWASFSSLSVFILVGVTIVLEPILPAKNVTITI